MGTNANFRAAHRYCTSPPATMVVPDRVPAAPKNSGLEFPVKRPCLRNCIDEWHCHREQVSQLCSSTEPESVELAAHRVV